jgi:hypothetical protein
VDADTGASSPEGAASAQWFEGAWLLGFWEGKNRGGNKWKACEAVFAEGSVGFMGKIVSWG